MGKLKTQTFERLDNDPQIMSTVYPTEPAYMQDIASREGMKTEARKHIEDLIDMRVETIRQKLYCELDDLKQDMKSIMSNEK